MYDSRTDHMRTKHAHHYCRDASTAPQRALTDAQAIAEGLADMEPEVEHVPVRLGKRTLDRLHAEALREDERRWNDLQDEAWAWLDQQDEGSTLEDAAWDDGEYDGYADEHWIPYMGIEELRDTFGHNWLGNGFHIINTTTRRSTKMDQPYTRKERNEDHARAEAMIAARQARSRHEALAAQVSADEPAKVTRPVAEHPEPAPYDKFAGAKAPHYDDSLDPISPNFDLRTW
jgi:hypothetical protein